MPDIHDIATLLNEGMGRVSPVQLLPWLGSHGITVLLQLALTSGNGSAQSFTTTSQIQSVVASHWHSLPLGTGTFHAACLGVVSLCVSCKSRASPAPMNYDDVTERIEPESITFIVRWKEQECTNILCICTWHEQWHLHMFRDFNNDTDLVLETLKI